MRFETSLSELLDSEKLMAATVREQHKYIDDKTQGKGLSTTRSTSKQGNPNYLTMYSLSEILQGVPAVVSDAEVIKAYQDQLDKKVAKTVDPSDTEGPFKGLLDSPGLLPPAVRKMLAEPPPAPAPAPGAPAPAPTSGAPTSGAPAAAVPGWYPTADRSVTGNSSGQYVGGPYRGVLHTTEGASAAGAISAFQTNNSWPHFLIDAVGKVWQFIDTTVGARTLKNPAGGVETNMRSAVQIEIVGFAGQPGNHSTAQLNGLKSLMRWIEQACGVRNAGPGKPFAGSSGQNVRFTNTEWDNFNGWCGHCHVPENDHWDPGAIDIANWLTGGTPPPPTPTAPASGTGTATAGVGAVTYPGAGDVTWQMIDEHPSIIFLDSSTVVAQKTKFDQRIFWMIKFLADNGVKVRWTNGWRPPSSSAHSSGRGADINNRPGAALTKPDDTIWVGRVFALLGSLTGPHRPKQVGGPFLPKPKNGTWSDGSAVHNDVGGLTWFTNGDHQDHIHVGY